MAEIEVVGTPTDSEIDKALEGTVKDTNEAVLDWDFLNDKKEETFLTTKKPETETKEEVDDECDIPYKFLGKDEVVKSKKEAQTLIQLGKNYDHVKEKADKADALEQELSELKLKLVEQDVENQKIALSKEMLEEGYDKEAVEKFVDKHPAIKKMQEMLDTSRQESQRAIAIAKRTSEKESLRKEPYFSEMESDIDKLSMLPNYNNVSIETIYELLLAKAFRSGKINEIEDKTRKSAIADMQDNIKRGVKSDGGNVPQPKEQKKETSWFGKALDQAMGLGKK